MGHWVLTSSNLFWVHFRAAQNLTATLCGCLSELCSLYYFVLLYMRHNFHVVLWPRRIRSWWHHCAWSVLNDIGSYDNYNDRQKTKQTNSLLMNIGYLLPAALRAAQTCRYFVYSEADFEVFRPAGATRCTDGGEIRHGGGDRRSPPPRQISPPSVQRQGCRTPKIEIFTQIWPKSGI